MSSTPTTSSENSSERAIRQAEGLKRLAQLVNVRSSEQQTLSQALETVAATLQVERCLLMRYEAKAERLVPLSPAFGFQVAELLHFKITLGQAPAQMKLSNPLFSMVFETAQPLYCNYNYTFSEADAPPVQTHNILIVPVLIEGQVQGLCVAINKLNGGFDQDDLETLDALAGIMASLLKNLNLINRLEGEKRRHLAVLDAAVDGFVEVGRDFRITLFSKGAENLTSWKAEEALGRTCSEVLLPHNPESELLCHSCPLQRSFKHKTAVPNVETLLRTRDGEDNWVSCSYNVVLDEQGEVSSGIIAIKDIYRIRALGDELRQQIQQQESLLGVINAINGLSSIEEIYSKALGEIANAIQFDLGMIHATKGGEELELMAISEPELLEAQASAFPFSAEPASQIEFDDVSANPLAKLEPLSSELLEYSRSNRRHRPEFIGPVLSGRSYQKQGYNYRTTKHCEALRQNEPYMAVNLPGREICGVLEGFQGIKSHVCVPIKTQEQTYGVLHLASYRPYAFWGSDFALALSICKQIAVAAERAHLFEQVDLLARTDPLTKLYNKREFWDRIEREMKRAERQRRPLSLIIIDLDRLKWYNDFYGHSQGDMLLSRMGQLILEKCRNTDVAFRYGGDELCLLLPDTGPREAFMVAERIRESAITLQVVVADEIIIGEDGRVTMSIGIASFPNDANIATDLFENADSAMYRAKETGKNRTVIYNAETDLHKRNYRRRIRPSEYVDDRLKPASPNPSSSL